LLPLTLPSLLPASLFAIAITHIVAFTITITLVVINHPPPLSPSLLPPKPLLSLSHSTLVADAVALFVALALFATRHSYPHCHCLATLPPFVTCSHC
jgi:hypothetical protein